MSYCTDCIHYKVCGNEGIDDSAMTFCADKQTNGDLISRQAVLEEILKQPSWHNSDGSYYHSDDIKKAVLNIPSINPQGGKMTDGDLISRQAVLDIFGDIHPLDYNARAYVAQIKELPSEKVDGDLISRDYVLSKFKEQCDRCGKYKENNGVMCNCCELDAAIDYVEDAPSAEKTDGENK